MNQPWQGQGTLVHSRNNYSAPEQGQNRSVWDWWQQNGDTAVDAASDLICLISPNSPRCRPAYPQGYDPHYAQRQDNTLLYVLTGVVVFLLLLMILKK